MSAGARAPLAAATCAAFSRGASRPLQISKASQRTPSSSAPGCATRFCATPRSQRAPSASSRAVSSAMIQRRRDGVVGLMSLELRRVVVAGSQRKAVGKRPQAAERGGLGAGEPRVGIVAPGQRSRARPDRRDGAIRKRSGARTAFHGWVTRRSGYILGWQSHMRDGPRAGAVLYAKDMRRVAAFYSAVTRVGGGRR